MREWKSFRRLVFVLPIPFGLNTEWAWLAASAWIFWLLAQHYRWLLQEQNEDKLPALRLPIAFQQSRPLLLALVALQFWNLLQAMFTSLSPYDSWIALYQGITYTAFFTLSLLLINTRERVTQIIWTIIAAATFQAVYGTFMVLSEVEWGFFQPKAAFLGNATGTFANRNHMAGYLEIALALGVGFILANPTHYTGNLYQRTLQFISMLTSDKVVLRLLLAVIVIALVMTRSRMGNTAFFASMIATGAMALFFMRYKTRSTVFLLSSMLIVDMAIVGTFFGADDLFERLKETSQDTESRDEVARDTFNIWKEYPILGTGSGTFTHVYPSLKSEDVVTSRIYNNAHNDILQFLSEFGLPAFLVLCWIVGYALTNVVNAMRKRHSHFSKGIGFGSMMAIVALMIHSTVDFNLQIPANALMFMLVLALSAISRWTPRKIHRDRRNI
tara:strand:+ start:12805 stop:14133 length:1329 start_codon:yes stop_codon:yes gene_type:complete